jgi:hypothetical protein
MKFIIAILIVLIIIIIILLINTLTQPRVVEKCGGGRKRRIVDEILDHSNGTWDEPARNAYDILRHSNQPADLVMRGDLLRFNFAGGDVRAEALGDIVNDYTQAIIGVRMGIGGGNMNHEFIIHRAEGLHGELGGLAANDLADDNMLWAIGLLGRALTVETPEIRRKDARQRVAEAIATSSTKKEAAEKVLTSAIHHTSDPQNVHDSQIIRDLKLTLEKLPPAGDTTVTIDAARKFINDEWDEPEFKWKATTALVTIGRGEFITTFASREDEIFDRVWRRCNEDGNKSSALLLKGAVARALADCVTSEPGAPLNTVCINGRCSRIIGSLALLDYDPTVGGALSFEEYKNQILHETAEIIDEVIADLKTSDNKSLAAAAIVYETGGDIDEANEKIIKDKIKKEIDRNLRRYDDKLSSRDLETLREQCYLFDAV